MLCPTSCCLLWRPTCLFGALCVDKTTPHHIFSSTKRLFWMIWKFTGRTTIKGGEQIFISSLNRPTWLIRVPRSQLHCNYRCQYQRVTDGSQCWPWVNCNLCALLTMILVIFKISSVRMKQFYFKPVTPYIVVCKTCWEILELKLTWKDLLSHSSETLFVLSWDHQCAISSLHYHFPHSLS